MKKTIAIMLVALSASFGAFAGEFVGSVGVMSDYVFRGESQSDEKVAVTGDVGYTAGGFSAGVVATSVDKAVGDDRVELDGLVSYRFALNKTFSADVGAIYYAYPGSSSMNTTEVNAALNMSLGKLGTQLKTSYSNDYFNDGNSWYTEVNGSYGLPYQTALVAHIGYTDLDNDSTTDYRIGLVKQFGKNVVGEVAYVDTNVNTAWSDSRWTVGAKYQF